MSRPRSVPAGLRRRMSGVVGDPRRRLDSWRRRRRMAGPRLLRAFARACPEAFFIEIGSNDGEQHDHLSDLIRSRPWRGIMVEPVPYVFRRLQANYQSNDRVALENVAVSNADGSRAFYHLREAMPSEIARLPRWYDGIGSFSRETVVGHRGFIPDIESRLIATEVPCVTFESLCRRHGVAEFDLLLLDTEGHEAVILDAVDLDAHSPRLVVFEHYHLSEGDRDRCRRRLAAAGYDLLEEGFDTWCIGRRCPDDVRAVWGSLEPGAPALSALSDRR